MTSLAGAAARGASITLLAQLGRMVVQIASVVVLSRLLLPADYGLVAMTVAVVGIGELLRDFGLSQAAIQAKTLSDAERDNLWWTNTTIGLLLGLACLAVAPLLAAIYDQDRLVPLTQALAVTFVLNGAATQYRAGLTRTMRFRSLAVADLSAPVLAFLAALTVALLGGGVWALVAQQAVAALTGLVVLVVLSRWRPGLPDRTTSIKPFTRFGGPLLGSQLIGYAANNIDSFLIGYRFGPQPLGYYNRAFQLLMTPLNQIRSPSTTVALPVLSRVGHDQDRFLRILVRGQFALGLPTAVGLALVIGAAEPAVDIFLGEGWEPVTPILRLMAVAGLFQTLAFVGYWAYLAKALTGSLLRYSMLSAIIKVTCIAVGIQWGLIGVAVGYAIAPVLSWPLSLWWLSRASGLRTRRLVTGALRVLAIAAPVAGATYAVATLTGGLPDPVQLAVAVLSGLGVAGLLALTPWLRPDVASLVTTVRTAIRERRG